MRKYTTGKRVPREAVVGANVRTAGFLEMEIWWNRTQIYFWTG
jgi:hypothetical protein